MQTVQFIGTTPTELMNSIREAVRQEFDRLQNNHSKQDRTASDEVMTRQETKELFSVSFVTIHDWEKKGILKSYKVGNRTYFKRSECMKVLNESNPESL